MVSSVPGYHYGNSKEKFGHLRVRKLLSEEDIPIEFEKSIYFFNQSKKTKKIKVNQNIIIGPTVFQFSSLGSLSENWLVKELVESFQSGKSFKRNQKNPIKIVYPTVENVRNCLEGYSGGSSLPVPKKNLKDFLKKIHGVNFFFLSFISFLFLFQFQTFLKEKKKKIKGRNNVFMGWR